jgi:ABC-2 type transport system permease protein
MSGRSENSWRTVWLVMQREVRARLRSKAFKVITGLLLAGMVALVLIIDATSGGSSSKRVGLTPQTAALAAGLRASADATEEQVTTVDVIGPAAGRVDLREGRLDALLVGSPARFRVVVHKELGGGLRTALTALARQQVLDRQIAAAGGDPAAVARAVAGVRVPVDRLAPAKRYQNERLGIGVVVGILIYLALLSFGQVVAQGVVEEKTSRVVELLLSTIRPAELMAGKVLGIGLVGLAQVVLLLLVGAGTAVLTGVLSLPASVTAGTALWSIVWFLLGFFIYALLMAAAGALVLRQEDIGSVTMPVMLLIIAPYVIGISTLPGDPGNPTVAALSIVPLFAPTLMPMRLAMGAATAPEVAAAVVLSLALIAVLVPVVGRIYRNAIMRIGARVPLSEAFRAA